MVCMQFLGSMVLCTGRCCKCGEERGAPVKCVSPREPCIRSHCILLSLVLGRWNRWVWWRWWWSVVSWHSAVRMCAARPGPLPPLCDGSASRARPPFGCSLSWSGRSFFGPFLFGLCLLSTGTSVSRLSFPTLPGRSHGSPLSYNIFQRAGFRILF